MRLYSFESVGNATAFSCTVVSSVTRLSSRGFTAFEASAASMVALGNDSTPDSPKRLRQRDGELGFNGNSC